MLEEQGYPVSEIDAKVDEFRQALLAIHREEADKDLILVDPDTLIHHNELKNKKMKSALGIGNDYIEGSAFNFEEKKQIAQAEKVAREERKVREQEETSKRLKSNPKKSPTCESDLDLVIKEWLVEAL
ncbi:hypothetical protein MXB_5663, partial [Myxobolus squamalis]